MSGNLNQQLQEYLSKSSGSGTSISIPDLGKNITSKLPWFGAANGQEAEPILSGQDGENGNGWFGQAQKDPCFPTLSKKQRIVGFVMCIIIGLVCFSLASMYLPFLLFKARKFALLYSLGSLFMITSFSLLWGPYNHMKHICSGERLPFTTIYFGSMFATVYFALSLQSTVLTVIAALCQILALLWYLISYIPGGQTGLKFFTKLFSTFVSRTASTVTKSLPV